MIHSYKGVRVSEREAALIKRVEEPRWWDGVAAPPQVRAKYNLLMRDIKNVLDWRATRNG